MNLGITSNNVVELGAVRQGLQLAWDLGFKSVYLEVDSMIVIDWLIDENVIFPPNVFPLLCDCRSLMARDCEVRVHHVYHEANECADGLAKQGNHQ